MPGVPKETKAEDHDGYHLFRSACKNVILFTGTHRFLDADLPKLLETMGTPGGRTIPDELKKKILAREQAGPDDPRYRMDFDMEGQHELAFRTLQVFNMSRST